MLINGVVARIVYAVALKDNVLKSLNVLITIHTAIRTVMKLVAAMEMGARAAPILKLVVNQAQISGAARQTRNVVKGKINVLIWENVMIMQLNALKVKVKLAAALELKAALAARNLRLAALKTPINGAVQKERNVEIQLDNAQVRTNAKIKRLSAMEMQKRFVAVQETPANAVLTANNAAQRVTKTGVVMPVQSVAIAMEAALTPPNVMIARLHVRMKKGRPAAVLENPVALAVEKMIIAALLV